MYRFVVYEFILNERVQLWRKDFDVPLEVAKKMATYLAEGCLVDAEVQVWDDFGERVFIAERQHSYEGVKENAK